MDEITEYLPAAFMRCNTVKDTDKTMYMRVLLSPAGSPGQRHNIVITIRVIRPVIIRRTLTFRHRRCQEQR
ncbi:Uncharacterised protein [Salmonella enterica subsp. enterica serovar Typhi]|nr:Uncharacterised protein [Salmonella enterica subsp. enterica serovar Typhi]CHG57484.1 Uncharacterised protein [Salmonella enterica subsp. enterica serovar Typhi]